MTEQHAALLRLMKPGVWYCASEYDGCTLFERDAPVRGRVFSKLIGDGYVECEPVFEGFSMKKYRITDMGSKWLAAL